MQKRPTGITVLFWVYLILGILSLLWSGMVLGVGGLSAFFGGVFGLENVSEFGNMSAWSGYLGIITALVQIVVAFGLASMKRWAWMLALVGLGLTLIQGAVGMLGGGLFALICGSLGLIIPVIILIYLLETQVLLSELSEDVGQRANLIAEVIDDRPAIFENNEQAASFISGLGLIVQGRIILLSPDGRLVASNDPALAGLEGEFLGDLM